MKRKGRPGLVLSARKRTATDGTAFVLVLPQEGGQTQRS
jgi:hypothetical protein